MVAIWQILCVFCSYATFGMHIFFETGKFHPVFTDRTSNFIAFLACYNRSISKACKILLPQANLSWSYGPWAVKNHTFTTLPVVGGA